MRLETQALKIGYGRRALLPVELDLKILAGEFWGIVGPNGAGKTTLLKTLLGLIRPISGRIQRSQGLRLGYVPQRSQLDAVFPLLTQDLVAMGLLSRSGVHLRSTAQQREQVAYWLEQVGLSPQAKLPLRELSGGQRQRALLARALAGEPDLLILDEPTDGLDLLAESELFVLTENLRQQRQLSLVVVSHRLSLVAARAEQVILFNNQSLETGPCDQILSAEHLQTLYQRPVKRVDLDQTAIVYLPGNGPL